MVRRPSLESTQSFELLSPPSGSQVSTFSSSDDDEIVWSVSSLSLSDRALLSPRLEDFVVLSPPSVTSSYATDMQAFTEDDLISNPSILSQPPTPQPHPSSRRSGRRRSCHAQRPNRGQASPTQSSPKPSDKKAPASPQSPKRRRKRSEKCNEPSPPGEVKSLTAVPPVPKFSAKGLGARSVVDDVSERGDDNGSVFGDGGSELPTTAYDKAVDYINW